MRVARLLLDAQQGVPPGLLLDAARAATQAGDPDLGAQLAELALRDGGGLDAALPLARAHAVRNRHEEAEAGAGRASRSWPRPRSPATTWSNASSASTGACATSTPPARSSNAPAAWADGRAWTHRLLPLRDLLTAQRSDFDATVRVTAEVLSDAARRRRDPPRQRGTSRARAALHRRGRQGLRAGPDAATDGALARLPRDARARRLGADRARDRRELRGRRRLPLAHAARRRPRRRPRERRVWRRSGSRARSSRAAATARRRAGSTRRSSSSSAATRSGR